MDSSCVVRDNAAKPYLTIWRGVGKRKFPLDHRPASPPRKRPVVAPMTIAPPGMLHQRCRKGFWLCSAGSRLKNRC